MKNSIKKFVPTILAFTFMLVGVSHLSAQAAIPNESKIKQASKISILTPQALAQRTAITSTAEYLEAKTKFKLSTPNATQEQKKMFVEEYIKAQLHITEKK